MTRHSAFINLRLSTGFTGLVAFLSLIGQQPAWSNVSGLYLPRSLNELKANVTRPHIQSESLVAVQYNPPNRGAPGRTRHTGSRTGPCGDLTAVQPTLTRWGETLTERPTFGIYVTEPVTNLTFELKDEVSGESLHKVVFDEVQGPGISLYTLPATVPSLEFDQLYRWQLSLDCSQFNTDILQFNEVKEVDGVIMRRVANQELQVALDNASEAELPALLAENGFWYDTVQALLLLRFNQPDNQAWLDSWQSLLKHPVVQLDNLLEAFPLENSLTDDCLDVSSH